MRGEIEGVGTWEANVQSETCHVLAPLIVDLSFRPLQITHARVNVETPPYMHVRTHALQPQPQSEPSNTPAGSGGDRKLI